MRAFSDWVCRSGGDYERPKPPPMTLEQRVDRLEKQVSELLSRVDQVFDAYEERITELEAKASRG